MEIRRKKQLQNGYTAGQLSGIYIAMLYFSPLSLYDKLY